ncbi:hypothetical protein EMIHUDRAFT_458404, partial [Emiliania huxleyi CCMP1516]|uniref:Uncharacterized protein n=2 Tax=Emiliania huxleyi TaxID=2903 RepID=A0A0D3JCU1_EMIH1
DTACQAACSRGPRAHGLCLAPPGAGEAGAREPGRVPRRQVGLHRGHHARGHHRGDPDGGDLRRVRHSRRQAGPQQVRADHRAASPRQEARRGRGGGRLRLLDPAKQPAEAPPLGRAARPALLLHRGARPARQDAQERARGALGAARHFVGSGLERVGVARYGLAPPRAVGAVARGEPRDGARDGGQGILKEFCANV